MRIQTLPTLLERFLADAEPAPDTAARRFRPSVDVFESESGFELIADLPGLRPEDVSVEFDAGLLELRGQRRLESPEGRAHRRERSSGAFHHTVALGDEVEVEAIEASFRDGVLRVRIPKSARARPRQVPVTVH